MPKFLNIGLVAAWIAVVALAAQIYGLGRRIAEIENHQNRTDTAAVTKFERDFFCEAADLRDGAECRLGAATGAA